jgi:hypothetical protein
VSFLLAVSVPEDNNALTDEKQVYTRVYPGLGLAVVARPEWFASFSAGGDDISEPTGLVHLWPGGPLCLGGPEPSRSMGIDYQLNYFGPLVDGRPVLLQQRGEISMRRDAINIAYRLPNLKIEQTFHWNGKLSFEQTVAAKRGENTSASMFVSGASQPPKNFKVCTRSTGPSPVGMVQQYELEVYGAESSLAVEMVLAEGNNLPRERDDYQVLRSCSSLRRTIWRKILKAAWVFWVKIVNRSVN